MIWIEGHLRAGFNFYEECAVRGERAVKWSNEDSVVASLLKYICPSKDADKLVFHRKKDRLSDNRSLNHLRPRLHHEGINPDVGGAGR